MSGQQYYYGFGPTQTPAIKQIGFAKPQQQDIFPSGAPAIASPAVRPISNLIPIPNK